LSRTALSLATYLCIAFGLGYALQFVWMNWLWFSKWTLLMAAAVMYSPFIASIAAYAVQGVKPLRALRLCGIRLGRARFMVLGPAIPLALYGIGLGLCSLAGFALLNPAAVAIRQSPTFYAVYRALHSTQLVLATLIGICIAAGVTVNTLAALGEETGWRGYLLNTLAPRLGLVPAALVIGVVWGLWHAPLILVMGFDYPQHPNIVGLSMFIAFTTGLSLALSALRALSESVIPCAMAHGTLNALARLMLLSVVGDSLYTIPVGAAGAGAAWIIGAILAALAVKRLRREGLERVLGISSSEPGEQPREHP